MDMPRKEVRRDGVCLRMNHKHIRPLGASRRSSIWIVKSGFILTGFQVLQGINERLLVCRSMKQDRGLTIPTLGGIAREVMTSSPQPAFVASTGVKHLCVHQGGTSLNLDWREHAQVNEQVSGNCAMQFTQGHVVRWRRSGNDDERIRLAESREVAKKEFHTCSRAEGASNCELIHDSGG